MRYNTGKPNTVGHRIKLHHAMHRFVYLAFTFYNYFSLSTIERAFIKEWTFAGTTIFFNVYDIIHTYWE